MGKTDPGARTYSQQSMILVPMDTPGINIVRPLSVYGYEDSPSKLCWPANFCDMLIYLTPKARPDIFKKFYYRNEFYIYGFYGLYSVCSDSLEFTYQYIPQK